MAVGKGDFCGASLELRTAHFGNRTISPPQITRTSQREKSVVDTFLGMVADEADIQRKDAVLTRKQFANGSGNQCNLR